MSESKETYIVNETEPDALTRQLTFFFERMSERLDTIEGHRPDTPGIFVNDGNGAVFTKKAESIEVENITITDLTASRLVATDGDKQLSSTGADEWLEGTDDQIEISEGDDGVAVVGTPQDIATTSNPTFKGINVVGGDLWFNADARIAWTKIPADGVTLGDGPPTSSDTVADLVTAHDGKTYTVDEKAAAAGQNLIVDFIGVVAFNWVQILAYYDGQSSHELQVQLEIAPYDDSAWHDYTCMNPDHDYISDYSFFVADCAPYINSGAVNLRILHNESGNANDDWVFNVVALYQ